MLKLLPILFLAVINTANVNIFEIEGIFSSGHINALERYVDGNDTYRRAQHNLSVCYFTIRNFKEGSRLYHFRHQPAFLDRFNKKRVWEENVDKGKVLIWAEQGIGDEILFMRFLKLLEKSDCQFFLECDPRIHRIVNINFPYNKNK